MNGMNNDDLKQLRIEINITYYTNIRYHADSNEYYKLNGPAKIWFDGDRYWNANGNYHRVGGPAVIYNNGSKYWYTDGRLRKIFSM